jgi:hypothetical protein
LATKNGKNFKEGFKLPEIGKWQPKARRDSREDGGDAHHIHQTKNSQAKTNKTKVAQVADDPDEANNGESHWIDKIN